MKITDLKPNEVIHCKTHEEAVRICGIAPNKLCTPDWWRHYKDNTCYDTIIGEFCSVEYATDNQLAIHPSELFQDSSDEITEEGLMARGFEDGNNASFFMKWDNGIRLVWFSGIAQVRFVSNHIAIPNCKTLTDIDHLIRLLGV